MKRLLNVGGQSKDIPLLPIFEEVYEQDMLDIDPTHNPEVLCDAREMLHLPPETYDMIYCSHNLEHYSSVELADVLTGFYHVMKVGGRIAVIVPNARAVIYAMVSSGQSLEDECYVAQGGLSISYADILWGCKAVMQTGKPYYQHKYGFDPISLLTLMDAYGFHGAVANLGEYDLIFMGAKREHPTEMSGSPDCNQK